MASCSVLLFKDVARCNLLDIQITHNIPAATCTDHTSHSWITNKLFPTTTNNIKKTVYYNVELWNSQPVEISRDDVLHLCCGGKERINSCQPSNRTSVTNGKHFMGLNEEIKLFQVHTGDCNVYLYLALHNFIYIKLTIYTHKFLKIHSIFERSLYFMLKEQKESTSDVIWLFGVPFQFDIFTTAINCILIFDIWREERQSDIVHWRCFFISCQRYGWEVPLMSYGNMTEYLIKSMVIKSILLLLGWLLKNPAAHKPDHEFKYFMNFTINLVSKIIITV